MTLFLNILLVLAMLLLAFVGVHAFINALECKTLLKRSLVRLCVLSFTVSVIIKMFQLMSF